MQGNLSIRYVPNQHSDSLLSHLKRHLEHEFRKLRSSNTLSVEVKGRGCASLPIPPHNLSGSSFKFQVAEYRRTANSCSSYGIFVGYLGTIITELQLLTVIRCCASSAWRTVQYHRASPQHEHNLF